MEKMESVYSDLKIFCHPDKLKAILAEQRTAPLYVRIKPTNICNQRCWYCVYADDTVIANRSVNRRESIPWVKLQEVISDLAVMGTKAITFSGGGEPLCYSHIHEAIELVKDQGIDFAMITNGQVLDERACETLREAKWLRISMDSANADLYKKIRGVDTYNKVLENIGRFAKRKSKDCTLGVNCVVTEDNYKHIYELCRILTGLGVENVKFSPLMVKGKMLEYHTKIISEVESQIKRGKEDFQNENFTIIDKYTDDESFNQEFQKCANCYIKEIFTVIGADCKVYYCHQRAYTEQGMIGDISNQSFTEMWFSDETTKKFRNMDPRQECNFRCAFEERNSLLDRLVNMDKRHVNFI